MANDLNKCLFVGRLGKPVETRSLSNGDLVANFSIAVGKSWKDKNTSQQQERTTWVRIVAFKRLAEICGQYLVKGSKVLIVGEFQERKWQDQSGKDCYATEIVASELQMLDSRPSEEGHQSSDAAREFYTPQAEPTQGPVIDDGFPNIPWGN